MIPPKDPNVLPRLREAREFITEVHGEEYACLGEACTRVVDLLPTRGTSPMELQKAYEASSFTRQLTDEEIIQQRVGLR